MFSTGFKITKPERGRRRDSPSILLQRQLPTNSPTTLICLLLLLPQVQINLNIILLLIQFIHVYVHVHVPSYPFIFVISGISPASHAVYAGLGQMGSNGGGSVVMERTSYMVSWFTYVH